VEIHLSQTIDHRSSRVAAGLFAITALLAPLLTGCGKTKPFHPQRIFLITVDTLRADHVSAYGYHRQTTPNVDKLAANGLLFTHAISQWPKTGPSFATMFTGRYPQTTGLTHKAAIHLPTYYETLAEMLHKQGYTTIAVVSNPVLGRRLGWNQGFDVYEETWLHGSKAAEDDPVAWRKLINARRVDELALPLLEKYAKTKKLFVWLHYSDPHAPYILPDGVKNPFIGDRYYTGDAPAKATQNIWRSVRGSKDADKLKFYVAQYDANVMVADRNIGKAIDEARSLGMLKNACLIFTADHGESLGEHDYYFQHGHLPYNETAHVPFIVYYPDAFGARTPVRRPVELVDLYPTLRDLAGAGKISGLEGKSLLPFLVGGDSPKRREAEDRFQYAFSEAGGGSLPTHFRSVQDETWKLIYHPEVRRNGKVKHAQTLELYDLAKDPLEEHDVASEIPDQVQRLRRILGAWMKGSQWLRKPPAGPQTNDQETTKALKALGYVN